MPIITECPSCSRKLRVPDELLGSQVKCPTCSTTFTAASRPGEAELVQTAPPVEEKPYPVVRREPLAEPDYERERRRDVYDDEPRGRSSRRPFRRSGLQPHRGQTILTLGILSLFVAGLILGPMAWIMGNNDLVEMRAGRMDPEGESNTNTGRICGMIATILHVSGLACCCLFMFLGAMGNAVNH